MFLSALPQSTAEVEKAFSRWNNNKNKLRDRLVVCSLDLEAIIKSSENFPGDCEANQRLTHSRGKARKTHFEKFKNSEAVVATTDEIFSL